MRKIKTRIRFIIQLVLFTILVQNAFTQKTSFFSEKVDLLIKLEPKIFDITEVRIKEKRKNKRPDNIAKLSHEDIDNDYFIEYNKPCNDNYLNIKKESVITRKKKHNKKFKIKKRIPQAYNNIGNDNIKYMLNNNILPFDENENSMLITHDALEEILKSHTNIYTNLLSISLPIRD